MLLASNLVTSGVAHTERELETVTFKSLNAIGAKGNIAFLFLVHTNTRALSCIVVVILVSNFGSGNGEVTSEQQTHK